MSCCSDTQELVFALGHENWFTFLSPGRIRFLMSMVAHPLLNWQRRSKPLHPMGTPYSRILRGHRVGLAHLAEEGFHFPSREKGDENPATCRTFKGPDMGNLARCQQRITRLEAKTLCPHLELELAFEDREPFILVIMQMACWTTFGQEGVLQEKRITWGRRTHLEGNGANAQPATLAFAISTGGEKQSRGPLSGSGFAHSSFLSITDKHWSSLGDESILSSFFGRLLSKSRLNVKGSKKIRIVYNR